MSLKLSIFFKFLVVPVKSEIQTKVKECDDFSENFEFPDDSTDFPKLSFFSTKWITRE